MQAFFLLLFIYSSTLLAKPDIAKEQSFELLSGAYNEREERWRTFRTKDFADLQMYSANYYDKIGRLGLGLNSPYRIPKLIHFIWVGPKEFPKTSVENLLSWQKLHPDWRLLFWTDSKDRQCPIKGMERHQIDEISFIALKPYLSKTSNYAEMADLIRYELIYERGGVYVDHDVHALKPFDIFNIAFDFYAALENPHTNTGFNGKIFPCNCLFGARVHHPILKEAIKNVQLRWDEVENKYPGNDAKSTFARVMNRTFLSFRFAVEDTLSQNHSIDMILPSSYFFADKIFKKSTRKELAKLGYVYATHAFASTWRDKKPNASSTNVFSE